MKKNIPIKAAMVFAVFVMLFGIYHIYRTVTQYERAEAEYTAIRDKAVTEADEEGQKTEDPDREPGIQVDVAALKKENPDTIGWIYYPVLNINYPIVQDEDNTYYIRRTFQGEKNAAGSIFLDCNADGELQDMHSIVYGHNMKNGSMFGTLKEIREEGTVEENPYFWIFLEDKVNVYRIFSYHDADVKDNSFLTYFEEEEDYDSFLQHITGKAEETIGKEPETSDKIVTLSTCTSDSSVRFLVHGKLVK